MNERNKKIAKNTAKTGAHSVGSFIVVLLKILGTVLLIGFTTCLVFACIFLIYVKTNLTVENDVTLEELKMNESSKIMYMDSSTGTYKELVTLANNEYRIWLDYDEIPTDVINATVAIEDQRFWEHNGVDWYRTSAAFVYMFLGDSTFGGSTLTQQLIKNITQEDEVTVQRKLLEIFRALEFEKQYSKEDIIEAYLNKVYFGHGCYGIEAAANYYFGKSASELSLAEIASIVGITNNPSLYSPFVNLENNTYRKETILQKMYELGYIETEQEYQAALNEELHFTGTKETSEGAEDNGAYSWFTDALYYDLIDDISEWKNCSTDTAKQLLLNGGYRIYSTLDPDIQACVDEVYEDVDNLPTVTGSSQQVQSAMVICDPYTGNVVALAGGVGDKEEIGSLVLNRATQSTRPPGSSIKPIASYAPCIEYGLITPDTKIEDSESVTLSGTDWMPNNDSLTYNGIVTIKTALQKSLNTVAAQLIDMLTPQTSYEFLVNNAGLTTLDPQNDVAYAPLALGELTYGVTVREMASAYTMFVNSGIRSEARLYTKITDADGNLLYDNDVKQNVAISAKTAYWMTDMLQNAALNGTGYEAYLSNMPTAGKTGTSGDKRDRWFVGYTPYYVGAVWTGYDTPAVMSCSGNPSAQIWNRVMTMVHENLEYKEFSVPDDTYLKPVLGVEEVTYTVTGVDDTGKQLYEETLTAVDGSEVTVDAKQIDDYEVVGQSSRTITIYADSTNDITFSYKYVGSAQVTYTVRGVDENGNELYSETDTATHNQTVTVNARSVDGYEIAGNGAVTLTIDKDSENVATFTYKKSSVVDPGTGEDPDPNPQPDPDPYEPEDPDDPGM